MRDPISLAGIAYLEPSDCCKMICSSNAAKGGLCSTTCVSLPTWEYKSLFDEYEGSVASSGVLFDAGSGEDFDFVVSLAAGTFSASVG